MDIFQGWYKDGTEGTLDYRALSSLYFVLQIVLAFSYFGLLGYTNFVMLRSTIVFLCVFLGVMFFTTKPYKVKWMNYADGVILYLVGYICATYLLKSIVSIMIAILFGFSVALCVALYFAFRCLKKFMSR